MMDDGNPQFETQSLELQIQEAKRRAIEFSHSLREARAQEAKALHDLQLERQKWIASLEEKNEPTTSVPNNFSLIRGSQNFNIEKGFAAGAINSNQIDVNTGEYISSQTGVFNGTASSTFGWNQLLNQYKEDILHLRSEYTALQAAYNKLVGEKSELMKALRDEQAKSQFRISQITEYEDEKNYREKKEEQLSSENLKLKQELAQCKDSIASLQIELRISAEQKQSLQKLAAEREVNRSSLRNSSEAEYMKYEKRIQEREELLRSYQTELRFAQEQARSLGMQLKDTLQQRDEYRSQQSMSQEAQQRLEQQIQQLLLDVQQLRDSKSTIRKDGDIREPAHQILMSDSPSVERNSFKEKQSSKVQAASPQSYVASSLESTMSGISGKVLVFPDQMKNNSENNLFKLVEQFNQLPGGDSVLYPSEHDKPHVVMENSISDRIDASLAEQYYRYNLHLADNHSSGLINPGYPPAQSYAGRGGIVYPVQPLEKLVGHDSIHAQLLGRTQLVDGNAPLSMPGNISSSVIPASTSKEEIPTARRKKTASIIANTVTDKNDSKSSQKLESKKSLAGSGKGIQGDHHLRHRGATTTTYTSSPANTTIPSGQRHYRSIAIAGGNSNSQRRATPPRDPRPRSGSNHHLESDSVSYLSKNSDQRTSSGSRKGTPPQRSRGATSAGKGNNETDSITNLSQSDDKKAGKKKRSSSAPPKAASRT